MAKKKQGKKKSKGGKKESTTEARAKPLVTLEEIDAISSEEEESGGQTEWNAEALALRKAISDGAFEHLLKKKRSGDDDEDDDEDEIEEIILDDESIEEEQDDEGGGRGPVEDEADEDDLAEVDDEGEEDDVPEIEDGEPDMEEDEANMDEFGPDNDDEIDDSEEDDDDDDNPNSPDSRALRAVTLELQEQRKDMPWVETLDVIPKDALPFEKQEDDGGVDIHDDLKREVAFYDMALQSVHQAREKCKKAGVPFSRPDDFFAEMVKSDDHMARVKDLLIFETKKMDAVAQRKANREQKLRSRESQANKVAEKAKRKKDHLKAVDDWAKSAAASRAGALEDDSDARYLRGMGDRGVKRGWNDGKNAQSGPNKKRAAANRKYGHGGKRGRFKPNDPKALNDMSDYNPRHGGSGPGRKMAPKRKGKRARDALRAKRKS